MYTSKQHAIKHYLEHAERIIPGTFTISEEEAPFTVNHEAIKLPPMVEADWDTNDTKEFDRLLYKIFVQERTLH